MKKRKEVGNMVNTLKTKANFLKSDERYCSIINSLEESLKEVQDFKKGDKKLKTWNEYLMEQEKEQ